MHKNTKIVTALIALGLVSPMAYATNGNQVMSVGSQNTALGGTGVANFTGAESTFANPAMLGKSKGSEVTGGFSYFKPTVTNTGFPGGTAATSSTKPSIIPDVSYSSRISDSLTYGIAVSGIAGMGVDYTTAPAATHISAKTVMSILRVIPTIAYNTNDYGVGFSPVFQYGSLAISYKNGTNPAVNGGEDTSTGFGYALGGYFNVMPALTVAASYQSEIAGKYGKQISAAGIGFGLSGPGSAGAPFGDDLDQPAEIKVGVAYTMSNITLAADYKNIQWGSAAGFKDFNWKDQTVIALGAKYAGEGYWLGLGYNKANDPIGADTAAAATRDGGGNITAPNGYRTHAINFFNNMFFPAIVKDSYTFGGGFDISKTLAVEGSAVISPKVTKTVDVASFQGTSAITTNTTTHSQQAVSLSLRYKF